MAYDASQYEARRRAYTENFGTNQALNAYAYFLRNQQSQRQQQDLQQNYSDATPKLMSAYGQRNLAAPGVQSGIFHRALQRFAQRRTQQFGDLQQNQNQDAYQYGLQKDNAQATFQSQLADLQSEQANQVSQDAQELLRLRFGG